MQIYDALRNDILVSYQTGDALPSEFELAAEYSVNRHTLRRAIDELVSDGIVLRQHGKGMSVLAPAIEYPIAARTRFTENLEAQGVRVATTIVESQLLLAKAGVAEALGIEAGEPVVYLEMLRMGDEKPFCLSSHFLPHERFATLLDVFDGVSLHRCIEDHFGVQVDRRESLVTAVRADASDCERLMMPRDLPILRVKSINVDRMTAKPIEYVVTRFRSDLAQITVQP